MIFSQVSEIFMCLKYFDMRDINTSVAQIEDVQV